VADQLVVDRPENAAASPSPRRRIDPRFRQRRIEVQRELGRRRLRVLIGVTAALVLLAAGLGVARSPLLAVRHVRIAGIHNVAPADVVVAAGLTGRRQLIDVNGGRARRAIEQLPWVRTARVSREWPTTVRIVVTERTPVAVVGTGAAAMQVDGTGRVLGPARADTHLPAVEPAPVGGAPGQPPAPGGQAAAQLPALSAGAPVPGALMAGVVVAAGLPPDLTGHVSVITVGAPDAVHLQLDGGVEVVLGGVTDLRAKLVAVVTLIAHQKLSPGVLDVSVPAAPVLTPAGQIGNFSTRTGG